MRKIFFVFTIMLFTSLVFGQVEPDTSCFDADIFCTEEMIEGTQWTLPDTIPGMFQLDYPGTKLCGPGGQPNNILYFPFVPSSNQVTIQLNIFGCQAGQTATDLGVQWGVYENCEQIYSSDPNSLICNVFSSSNDGITGISTGSSSVFVPGNTYVLFVDGYGGSVCSFTINFIEGLSSENNPFNLDEISYISNNEGDLIFDQDTIDYCKDGFLTFSAIGSINASYYLWNTENELGEKSYLQSNADTLKYTFTEADSLYKICVTASTDCDDSEEKCFFVQVDAEANDTLSDISYCISDLALGVIPPDWEGETIYNAGTYYHTVTDSIKGCTHYQIVKVISKAEPIETFHMVACDMDTVFYNGDTIVTNYFDKQYFFDSGASNGCDSTLNFTFNRFYFEGEINPISCLSNGVLGLEIESNLIVPNNSDSIQVIWFKENLPILNSSSNPLELAIDQTGLYSAMITLFKNGQSCNFDLEEIEITNLPSLVFSASQDSICMTDTLTVSLESYVAGLNYQWLNTDEVIHLGNGVFQLIWYAPGNFNLQLKMGLDDCEFFSEYMAIYVELPLAEPQVNCYETSNDSITVNWTSIQCATDYEVWLDGSLVDLIQDTIYTFQDLEDGQNYEISIVAISDCLCPSAIGTINCITEDCPENVELSIDQLPLAFCVEEFTENLTLTGAVTGSTGGDISWISTITDGDGMIDANTIQPGVYPVSFRYQINSCIYEQIDTFTLYPGVEYDLEVYDISCYYNNDGEIIINPITGSTPFEFYLDGTLQDALETGDLTDGNYLLKVVDANACSFEETISIIRPDEPQIEIGGITLVERGNQYEYEITISQVTYDSIVWYLPVLDSVLCQGSCDQISFAPTDDVELCIEIFYDDDCSMDTCVQIRVNRDVNVFFPNVFSPGNKDGINDYFIPVVSSYESLKVITFDIYDRWGGLMFHKANEVINSQTGEQFGWDGTFDGQEAMSGVYVYYLQLEDSEGEIMHYYGDLTLLR